MLASVLPVLLFDGAVAADTVQQHTFTLAAAAEIVAELNVRCDACDWAVAGREAVVLRVTLDSLPATVLPVVRKFEHRYSVLLGRAGPGVHTIRVTVDEALTSRELRGGKATSILRIAASQVPSTSAEFLPVSLAPFVYARPNTVGWFTDIPLLMWYEREPTARGTRYRYSVVFSNEDGGTPADRLMATWGRTTDIEYIYSVEVNSSGEILRQDMQGPKHEILPYRGSHVQGRHPELWVSTDNNMVLDRGLTGVRYAPAPVPFALTSVSREAVMDAHPWLYEIMAKELSREGKIAAEAPPGKGVIPDPRHYAYLESCAEVGALALAFSVRIGESWIASDRGVPEYRIARDGCFRVAVPMPGKAAPGDIRAIRVHAHARADALSSIPARLTRVNTLFVLDDRYVPGRRLLKWEGLAILPPGGEPLEISIR